MEDRGKALNIIKDRLTSARNKVKIMEAYIDEKRKERDWHGVWDAAMELDTVDKAITEYEKLIKEFSI